MDCKLFFFLEFQQSFSYIKALPFKLKSQHVKNDLGSPFMKFIKNMFMHFLYIQDSNHNIYFKTYNIINM